MYLYWTDNWETPEHEKKEDKRNKDITELLTGRRCPRMEEILRKLKGERR